jgi:formylglycine-generating enzyme required for sulfatase activity
MMFGDDKAGRWDFFKHFNSPKLNQEPGFLAKSGEYEGCGTPDGVYDLVGNLHEWVSTSVSTKFMQQYRRDPIRRHGQPWHLGNAIFMGGFFSTTTELGHGCHFTTIAHGPKYHDYSTGFRCCRDATTAVVPAAVIPAKAGIH